MTNTTRTKKFAFFTTLILFVMMSALVFADGPKKPEKYDPTDGWRIPPPVKKIQNPVEASEQNIRQGKTWYERSCQSCHGAKGQADGPDSAGLGTYPGDFMDPAFLGLEEGVKFFMIKQGKDDMPAFNGDLTDPQIWQVIRYMETFGGDDDKASDDE